MFLIRSRFSECSIYINTKLVARASSANQKTAKKEAATIALDELRKFYYTIKVRGRKYKSFKVVLLEMQENM